MITPCPKEKIDEARKKIDESISSFLLYLEGSNLDEKAQVDAVRHISYCLVDNAVVLRHLLSLPHDYMASVIEADVLQALDRIEKLEELKESGEAEL